MLWPKKLKFKGIYTFYQYQTESLKFADRKIEINHIHLCTYFSTYLLNTPAGQVWFRLWSPKYRNHTTMINELQTRASSFLDSNSSIYNTYDCCNMCVSVVSLGSIDKLSSYTHSRFLNEWHFWLKGQQGKNVQNKWTYWDNFVINKNQDLQ